MSAVVDNFVAPPCHDKIEILFHDEDIVLINKPGGLLSLSGKNPLNKDSVHYRMVQIFPTVTLAHRLDFGTSGIMLLALNKAVNAHLTRQFQDRTVIKTYMSLLDGHLDCDQGCIDVPIAKDKQNFPLQRVCYENGKQALSQYEVLERIDNPVSSRVLFTPSTGRTHQLRIHSREIGHSILGCDLYGTDRTQAMAVRLMLHAFTLEFDHPVTGERMVGESPCPF